MFAKVSRGLASASLLLLIVGCTSTDKTTALTDVASATPPAGAPDTTGASVVQGTCPQIVLRDGTAYYRSYAKAGDTTPDQLQFQASFADTTRSCTMSDTSLIINVVAQGRVVGGPAGKPGPVTLPVRVTVLDGETELYSQMVNYQVELPADTMSNQFVFTKPDVAIPGGAGKFAKVLIGFDQTPVKATPVKKKKK